MRIKFLAIFSLLFTVFTAQAQSTTALNQLDKLLSGWTTLSADFTQQIFTPQGKGLEVYRGEIYLNKPNRFRWVIAEPEKQLIVADGKNVWIYDEELEQVTVQPLSNQLSETPALFLSGEFTSIAQGFNVEALKNTESLQQFRVTPKKEDSVLEYMILSFDADDKLSRMQIKDVFGQTTGIVFSRIVLNPKLDSKLFTFVPPKNVDVVGEELG
ncbi:MAG: outer membrane lipoprotein chaperone LolA [Gammaproteobacteria bacterium]